MTHSSNPLAASPLKLGHPNSLFTLLSGNATTHLAIRDSEASLLQG